MREGVLRRWADHLPIGPDTPNLDLSEGSTPLVNSTRLGPGLDIELHFKWEGANPTGSFKDRGMVVAVAKAKEEGSTVLLCASTGNTSASAAAYGARAHMRAVVIVPESQVAMQKLSQALMYGAKVVSVPSGGFDGAFATVQVLAERYPSITVVNSTNPYRLEGQKTAAFEICDDLGGAPDYLVLPVGNAGNITAYWMGFKQYRDLGRIETLPKMVGAQAQGAAPLVTGQIVDHPKTVASAIQIGKPASRQTAYRARDESGGVIESVTDTEILSAQTLLAASEGLLCEPASAAPLALIINLVKAGRIASGSKVVCVLTGNGLKDPSAALSNVEPPLRFEGSPAQLAKALKL